MQPNELRALRVGARLTQADLGKMLGLSGPYIGEIERGEKPIEARTIALIDAHIRHRIDVSWSSALGRWTVSVSGPGVQGGPVHRVHEVTGVYDSQDDAMAAATALKADRFPLAHILVTGRGPIWSNNLTTLTQHRLRS